MLTLHMKKTCHSPLSICFLAETGCPQPQPFKASWPHYLLRKRDDPYPESPALGPTLRAEALKKNLPMPLLQGRVQLVWHGHWEVCSFKICPAAGRALPLTPTLLQTISKQHILLRIRVSDGPEDKELTRPEQQLTFAFVCVPAVDTLSLQQQRRQMKRKGWEARTGNFPSISHLSCQMKT